MALPLGGHELHPKATVKHRVYANGVLHLALLGVEWYDNAPAYLGCVRDLQALDSLSTTTTLTIVSNETPYRITDQASFRQWVAAIFEEQQPWGFHERLKATSTN